MKRLYHFLAYNWFFNFEGQWDRARYHERKLKDDKEPKS